MLQEYVANLHSIVSAARDVEQKARKVCFGDDANYRDQAEWYAYSVYVRRIMRYAGYPSRGWVSLWLKPGL